MSDYQEFVKVYDYLNQLDETKKQKMKVKEMYNRESYIQKNRTSMINIKERWLSKYNLLQPDHPLVRRYAKFLYDNFTETHDLSNQFLIKL